MPRTVRKNILLVEDDAMVAMNEKRQLATYGYAVRTVATGEQAVEAARTSSDIDLILMDINLGSGIDGTEAAQIILQEREIPIVFLSSHTDPEVVERTEKITSYGYVVKSSSITVLDASIKMAFKLFEAETNRNKQHRLLSMAEEINGMGSWSWNPSTNEVKWSDNMCRIFGIHPDAFDHSWDAAIKYTYPDDLDIVREYAQHIVSKKERPPSSCYRIIAADNSVKWLQGDCTVSLDAKGEIVEVIGTMADITHLKRSEAKWRSYIERAPDGVFVADKCGKYIEVNEAACRITGYSEDELLGRTVFSLVQEEYLEIAANHFQSVVTEGYASAEVGFVTKSGEKRFWNVDAVGLSEDCYLGFVKDTTERRQSEEELRQANAELLRAREQAQETEEWTRYIIKHNPNAVAIFDNEMNILMVSDRFLEDYGLRDADIIGRNHYEVFPEIPERWRTVHTRALQGEILSSDDDYLIRLDGSTTYTRWECRPWYRSDRSIGGMVAYTEVITDRKQAEEALQQERNMLRSIIDSIPDAIFVKDADARNLIVNTADWHRTNFKSKEDLIGKDVFEIFPPEIAQPLFDIDQRILKHGESVVNREQELIMPNGEHRWQLITKIPMYDQDGAITGLIGIGRDITERKKLEDSLKASEDRWRSLVENNPDFIAIHDDEGRFIYLNRYAEGYSEDDIVGTSAFEYMPEESKRLFQEKERECLEKSVIQRFEHCASGDKGSAAWYENFLIPLVADETQKRVIVISRDVTDRKQAEEETRKQLAEKETLLREVHHRVKNHMATIESLLSLQVGSTALPEVKAALQDTISRVQSTRILYDKLLVSDNLTEVSIKPYANGLIDAIAKVFDLDDNRTIERHIADFGINPKNAFFLGIIINELLTNVFKYAFIDRPGGTVSVSIGKEEGTVKLIIHDNGGGFDERTLNNESPGFGLTVVRMLVEQSGGVFSQSNDNGAKSVVRFEL